MIEDFRAYIRNENLLDEGDKLVLAVSGGIDSMVMLTLFQHLENEFAVAHCNFKLRGAESDGEEVFLRDYCAARGIELFVKHFETREFASQKGISIEMAARDLRYNWFAELLDVLSYSCVATAHHQDDLIETMLLNLSRGTGIRGLTGIRPKNGKVIRPMLFANRGQILEFARRNNIAYMNDSSNNELLFQRNIIRHQVIPAFEEMNPVFRKNALKTALILRETEMVFRDKIDAIRKQVQERDGPGIRMSMKKIADYGTVNIVLFELLYPFGFNSYQVQEIYNAFSAEAGKTFFSENYRLVKDRDFLIITPRTEHGTARFYIEAGCQDIDEPVPLRFEIIERKGDFQFSRDPRTADLDLELLHFPLILKKWEQGEYFRPLGLTGLKKLSDFFTDEKMSIPEKEAAWILYSGKNVVWILGRRIDDRYKVTSRTAKVFRIRMNEGI